MSAPPDASAIAVDAHEHEQRAWFYAAVAALLSTNPDHGAPRADAGPCAPWCSRPAFLCPLGSTGPKRAQVKHVVHEGGPIGDLGVLGALAEEYARALEGNSQRASWLAALQRELLERSGPCLDLLARELSAQEHPQYLRVGKSLAARLELDRAIFELRR